MKLKTFRANSMADALVAVKSELGRDAVILHTRSIKSGGFFGFRAKTFVEVTASDESPLPRKRPAPATQQPPEPARRSSQVSPLPSAAVAQAYTRHSPPSADAPPPKHMASKPPDTAAQALPDPISDPISVMRVRERRIPAADPKPTPSLLLTDTSDIRRELSDIKLLVSQVLRSSAQSTPAHGSGSDALFKHYMHLLGAQVSREIADRIIGAVRDELNAGELADDSIVRTTVLRHLAAMIPVAPVADPAKFSRARADERDRSRSSRTPFVVALVGPTGVGKTTTLAKLAASYKLRQGRSVALITSDTYRIAAVDQIRTYAGIIGLPLRVVMSPGEMAAAVESFSSHDVILIDTAGRSQHNTERLAELAEFIDAAKPDETHLVLSSTAAPEVLFSAAEAFAPVRPNRVILTKLDEAVHFGVVVNIMQRLNTQLSFVTTGQEVPDHIEPGHSERLARLVMDHTADRSAASSSPVSATTFASVSGA